MQDSLWQCFLAWRAASRPVHPSALHQFALQSAIQSCSVFHRCAEHFVVPKCPDFWGSSKQHPMWSLNILISTRWRTFGSQLRLPRQFREWNRGPPERTVKSQDTGRYCKIFYNTWIFNTKYWTRWCIMNSFSLGGADCRWLWCFLQIVPPWHSLFDAHVTLWDEIRDHYMDRSHLSQWCICGSVLDTPRRLPPSTLAQILRRDDISIVHENEAGLRYPVVGIKRFVVSVLVIECYWYTISAERRNLQQPRYEVYKNIQMICLWYLWHQNIRDIDIYDNIPVARSQVPRIGAATIGCQIFDFVVEMASSLISSGRGDEAHGTLCGIQWLISYCFLKCFWFSGKTTVFGCIHMYSTSRYMETLSKYHN